MKITRILTVDEIAGLVSQLEKEGYCIIRKYLSDRHIHNIDLEMENCYELFASKFGLDGYLPPVGIQSVIREDRIINNVFYFNRELLEVATSGSHLDVIKPFLNDPFYKIVPENDANFILAQLNAREGRVALPFHVDTRMCTIGATTWSMQGYLSLRPINAENGGLLVVPQSHTSGKFPDSSINYKDAVSLTLEAGDLVLFSSELWHATTKCNYRVDPVWTILFTYRCWWVKQQYDIEAIVPSEWMKELTPNQKLILGACSRVSTDLYSASSLRRGYEIL